MPFVYATTIFSNDFEEGNFSQWGGNEADATIETTNPHHNTYNLQGELTSGENNGWSGAYKAVSGSTLYLRAYVKLQAIPNTDSEDQWVVWFGQDTAANALAYGGIRRVSGTNYWAIWYISTGTTLTYNVSSTAYSSGWHYLELGLFRGTSSNGWVKLWVDGVLTLSSLSLDNDGRTLSYMRVGFSYSDAPSSATAKCYVDCVVLANAYIGAEASAQALSYSVSETLLCGESVLFIKESSFKNTETNFCSEALSFVKESSYLGTGTSTISDLNGLGVEAKNVLTDGTISFDLSIMGLSGIYGLTNNIIIGEIANYGQESITFFIYILNELSEAGVSSRFLLEGIYNFGETVISASISSFGIETMGVFNYVIVQILEASSVIHTYFEITTFPYNWFSVAFLLGIGCLFLFVMVLNHD